MSTVTLTTHLPLSATSACGLARKPELFEYVVRPVIRMPRLTVTGPVRGGTEVSARIWWFGVIPAWTHHLKVIRLEPTEIYTKEWGGPVRIWNHRLSFTPVDEHSCTYIDEIEIADGFIGFGTRIFARLLFRYRHARWRSLARVLAEEPTR